MLINGHQIIMYKYNSGLAIEIEGIPSYRELLNDKVEYAQALPIKAYSYHDILSKDLQRAFQKENYLGDSTPHDIKLFALNFLNLILLKTAINHDDLIGIGVSEDFGVKELGWK